MTAPKSFKLHQTKPRKRVDLLSNPGNQANIFELRTKSQKRENQN